MDKPLNHLTIEEAAAALENGECTSLEITESCLAAIEAYDKEIQSFVRVEAELARAQAKASDERRAAGKSRGVLDGIPYCLKDVYATKDSPTTASSHMLEEWQAPYNATVYHKLQEAGAVLLGKSNTDEFTMGGSTETSYFGVTKNPWDLERVSGGSSGGPAAAMAARLCLFAIGTDTGGSVRQPAAFCGVVGVRPTYGRVSRFGELAMASSLDQTGVMAQTVKDASLVLSCIAGHDPLDATSSPEPVPQYLSEKKSLDQIKIGISSEFFGEGIDPELENLVREAINQLKGQGAEVVEVHLPGLRQALAAYYIIVSAEVSSNMARYDGIHFGHSVEKTEAHTIANLYDVYAKSRATGFGAEVKRRIMLGTHVLSSGYYDAYYNQAEKVRAVVAEEFHQAFQQVDVLAAPVSPTVAFKIGEHSGDPLAMYKEDVLSVPSNIGGVASISVPCGFLHSLPVGLQFMAARFNEEALFQVGQAWQEMSDFHQRIPALIRND